MVKIIKDVALTYDDVYIRPQYSEMRTRKDCKLLTRFTKNYKISIPIVGSPMTTVVGLEMMKELENLGGIAVLPRFNKIEEQEKIIEEFSKHLLNVYSYNCEHIPIAVSVGVVGDYIDAAQRLIKKGANIIVIDVAHGHHILTKNAIYNLKKNIPSYVDIVAGNIATAEAARDLIEWGADALRCGIGGGSACTTRVFCGTGVPMISCLQEIREVAEKYDIPIIADGGMRNSGDICKALCFADSVMLGAMLAGTPESPGEIFPNGIYDKDGYSKIFYGSASYDNKLQTGEGNRHIEGISTRIPLKPPLNKIITQITQSLKSAMSYTGVDNLIDYRKRAILQIVTQNGHNEALPHILIRK